MEIWKLFASLVGAILLIRFSSNLGMLAFHSVFGQLPPRLRKYDLVVDRSPKFYARMFKLMGVIVIVCDALKVVSIVHPP